MTPNPLASFRKVLSLGSYPPASILASVATATPEAALSARKLTPFPSRMLRNRVMLPHVLIYENTLSTPLQQGLYAMAMNPLVQLVAIKLRAAAHFDEGDSTLADHRVDGGLRETKILCGLFHTQKSFFACM